jgi:hypothetical protein
MNRVKYGWSWPTEKQRKRIIEKSLVRDSGYKYRRWKIERTSYLIETKLSCGHWMAGAELGKNKQGQWCCRECTDWGDLE